MITKINTYKLINDLLINEQKLDEGLIMTHDVHSCVKAIERFLKLNQLIKLEIIKTKIKLTISDFHTNSLLSFFKLLTNLGYYMANIKLYNNFGNPISVSYETFKNNYLIDEVLKNIKQFVFTLEPKFDVKHKLLSNTLYHVTEQQYVDKILKNGLISKSRNTLSDYPERIYFIYNLEDAYEYIKKKNTYYSLYTNKGVENINYTILEINLPNNDLIFYEYPKFTNKGIYTYDNINPNFIKEYE